MPPIPLQRDGVSQLPYQRHAIALRTETPDHMAIRHMPDQILEDCGKGHLLQGDSVDAV